MPRNLSESQLVQMSTKAISNVTNNWFKNTNKTAIKKLGIEAKDQTMKVIDQTLPSKNDKPLFILGDNESRSCSGSDECFNSKVNNSESKPLPYAQKGDHLKKNNFLPSVGIVMCDLDDESPTKALEDHNIEHIIDIDRLNINNHECEMPGVHTLSMELPVSPTMPNPQICLTSFDSEHMTGSNNNEYFRSVFTQ